ncbi:MAG TPA: hypothetical protein VNO31_31660 [Umezawaea sp.]|nr:hypothetical protein [Umezawaea sp.]
MATDLSTEFPTTADREAEISRLCELAIDFADRGWEQAADQAQDRATAIRAL